MKGNMSDTDLKNLEAEEARLWAVCNQADEASKKANAAWCSVHTLRKHELLRRQIAAEIAQEQKGQTQ